MDTSSIEIESGSSYPDACGSHRLNTNDSVDRVDSVFDLGQYRPFLRRRIKLSPRLRKRVDESDLVQSTLLEAYRKLHQFRGRTPGQMAAWLAKILSHNFADTLRAQSRKKRQLDREEAIQSRDSQVGVSLPCGRVEETPSQRMRQEENATLVHRAIEKLLPQQAQVIRLHHFEGKSLQEVADQLGTTRSSVAGLLYRGLKNLRGALDTQP